MKLILTFLFAVAAVAFSRGQLYHGCPLPHYRDLEYENPLNEKWLSAYDVKSYLLDLSVSNESTWIEGSASLLVGAEREMDTLVLELQEALTVSEVRFSDVLENPGYPPENTLEFERSGDIIFIELDRVRGAGELFRVIIFYEGDAGQDRGFFAGITTETDHDYGFDVTYTLSEPFNAKDWFPVKQVLEDKIDSVTFRLRCDRKLLAASNGLLIRVEEEGDDHILTWQTKYPMAYYLLSFAVADYRDFSFRAPLSEPGDSVLVQNYIYDSDRLFTDWEEQIRMTAPLIHCYSRLLADYPFAEEKYGHALAPMGGGMEHQTMTTLQDFSFYLVAHELAHQWFGDFVTCGNWQDIWINEGFASYFEFVAAEELLGEDAASAWMENAISIALGEFTGSVYVPTERVEDTYRLFDYGLSYKKGALLVHMIRFILNDDELFFGVLERYLSLFGNGLATGDEFRSILESESGQDFSCFFEQWYYGEGYPKFKLYWDQQGDSLKIRCEQTTTAPEVTPFFKVPFELEIRISGGKHQRVRLEQDYSLQEYSLGVNGTVEDLIFDPDSHLLKTAQVIRELPDHGPFRYGPNPVSSELIIQFPNTGVIDEIRLTSLSGREVLKWSGVDNPVTMDLSFLADGAYLLELTCSTGTYTERIVKITGE